MEGSARLTYPGHLFTFLPVTLCKVPTMLPIILVVEDMTVSIMTKVPRSAAFTYAGR